MNRMPQSLTAVSNHQAVEMFTAALSALRLMQLSRYYVAAAEFFDGSQRLVSRIS
jgi:hypothetical protein